MKPNHFGFRIASLPPLARGGRGGRLTGRFAPRAGARLAFTLVEMLVAVALVVLMMTLFTTIFQMATGSLSKQKALAEGDQRVRLVLTLLRGDLNNRTFQEVTPYEANDAEVASAGPFLNADKRKGYFYIAENNPDDDTDDVLGFTIAVSSAEDRLFGAAKRILSDAGGSYGPGNPVVTDPYNAPGPPTPPGTYYWQNQPEFDDQTVSFPNKSASSSAAEVVWFLRNGTLYRRVLLFRDPGLGVPPLVDDYQATNYPSGSTGLDTTIYEATGSSNFLSDFDYSAHLDTTAAPASVKFHGLSSLDNVSVLTAFPLGRPQLRFGFGISNGLPREHMQDAGGNWFFIGRFTHEETSYLNASAATPPLMFGYPARINANSPDPYSSAAITYDPATGKVAQYAGGSRIAEDIVMTNVLRFDVKVFDEASSLGIDNAFGVTAFDDDLANGPDDAAEIGWPGSDDGQFVDIGHAGARGFYRAGALANNQFCPVHPSIATTRLFRFDTWHQAVDNDGDGTNESPPYRTPNLPSGEHRPLRAIQIRITFFDITSQSERDVTFVQSLKAQ